jgi:hypothetical protein
MPQLKQRLSRASLIIAMLGILVACKNSERTWSAESKSPDGKIVATAETLAPAGWGTASPAETYVSLNWTSGSQEPTVVFSFNAGSQMKSNMNVGMHWVTLRHLELTYRGSPTIDFQAIQWQNVEISARSIAGNVIR